jgi:hypothetical protein
MAPTTASGLLFEDSELVRIVPSRPATQYRAARYGAAGRR